MTRLDENALLRSQLAELEVSLQALKEENAMLRDGIREERTAVVAFMRADPEWPACPQCRDAALYVTASAIERGEHRREEGP
jgi:hypothetical protein